MVVQECLGDVPAVPPVAEFRQKVVPVGVGVEEAVVFDPVLSRSVGAPGAVRDDAPLWWPSVGARGTFEPSG